MDDLTYTMARDSISTIQAGNVPSEDQITALQAVLVEALKLAADKFDAFADFDAGRAVPTAYDLPVSPSSAEVPVVVFTGDGTGAIKPVAVHADWRSESATVYVGKKR